MNAMMMALAKIFISVFIIKAFLLDTTG
jgi:hypothetical protein